MAAATVTAEMPVCVKQQHVASHWDPTDKKGIGSRVDPRDADALIEARKNTKRIGMFWFVDYAILPSGAGTGLTERLQTMLEMLEPYFAKDDGKVLREYVVPTNNEDPRMPALRTLDFALTNTFKALPVVVTHRNELDGSTLYNPHDSYTQELQVYHRDGCDPFRRHERVYFRLDDTTHYTTVAQLHFWKWMLESGKYDLIVAHEHEVLAHSRSQTARDRRERKRSRELSASTDAMSVSTAGDAEGKSGEERSRRKRRSALSRKHFAPMVVSPSPHTTIKF